jgi:hypothetical protein
MAEPIPHEHLTGTSDGDDYETFDAAIERLENAVGGR